MAELTRPQQKILDFIQRELHAGRPVPTQREIAAEFGFRSKRAAACHLDALKRKGALANERGKARSWQILSPLLRLRSHIFHIPIFGSIPAGLPAERQQEAEGCVSVDVESIGFKPTRNTFALRVTGDSMMGKHIIEGDIVVLEHGAEPRPGEVVAALIDGESTLKTYMTRSGRPYLRAENPRYPDLLPAQELVIQGVMVALIRKRK